MSGDEFVNLQFGQAIHFFPKCENEMCEHGFGKIGNWPSRSLAIIASLMFWRKRFPSPLLGGTCDCPYSRANHVSATKTMFLLLKLSQLHLFRAEDTSYL